MSAHTQNSSYSGGGLVKWIDSRLPIFTFAKHSLVFNIPIDGKPQLTQ